MKEKIIMLKPKNISQKQWAILLLELNILKKAWKPYGVNIEISAPGVKKIIQWGTKPYAETNRRSRKQLAQDERSEI
tara:strand:+ start:197 stop:427 length:231 start_codon:yes stop_codon:yes gene_type:complete